MDTCNWGSVKAEQPTSMDVEGGDWRSYLQMNSRQRIVNKIIETLKRHLPFSEQDGLHELRKIAVRLEEKIYTAATSQSDYLRKISLKMLTMETNSQNQNPVSKSMPSNSNGNGANPSDPEKIFASTLKQLNSVDTGDDDWRSQLPLESRQRIVNNIMERLKRHLPISSQEGLHELEKFALSVEEKIYSAATSQSDYLRKISLKMLSLETKSQNQNPMANSFASKSDGYGENPPDSEKFSASTLKQPNSMDIGDGDWRSQLQLESRQRIVNKILCIRR